MLYHREHKNVVSPTVTLLLNMLLEHHNVYTIPFLRAYLNHTLDIRLVEYEDLDCLLVLKWLEWRDLNSRMAASKTVILTS